MYHIVYLSSVVGSFDEQQLKTILLKSRVKNTSRGITGMLLFSDDNIMQVLEGEQHEVAELYQVIERDFRHTRVIKLSDGKIAQRTFPDWSMGFTTAAPQDFERLLGYFNPDAASFPASSSIPAENEVLDLLKEFCHKQESSFRL